MASDPDEATQALIAKLLAEDNPYGDYDEFDDDSESDGWDTRKRKKSKKSAAKTEKAPRAPKAPRAKKPATDENTEYTASGRKRRKDAGQGRAKGRAWSEEEEKLFLEALELFGRNWKKCAEHVGTRDPKSFTSHAQKHFIKLCLQGKALPAKVVESGDGYTLSGKPLDPNSAAARAYGFKPDSLASLMEKYSDLTGLAIDGDQPSIEEQKVKDVDAAATITEPVPENNTNAEQLEDPISSTAVADAIVARKRRRRTQIRMEEPSMPAPEQTEYAKNRSRRSVSQAKSTFKTTGNSFSLVNPSRFMGVPGSGASSSQPFKLHVSAAAKFIVDLHAHLCTNEVIGFLGGRWDPVSKVLEILRAFPGRGQASGMDVEMDPLSEIELRSKIEEANMTVVGWYHSHPVFAPKPSGIDIDNQSNYQNLCRDDKNKQEPFVGLIVSPYDIRLPGPVSSFNNFWVKNRQGGDEEVYTLDYDEKAADKEELDIVENDAKCLVTASKEQPGRVHMTELWRPFTRIEDGEVTGGPVTKLAKLRTSLLRHLVEENSDNRVATELLDRLGKHMQEECKVDLGY